MSKSVHILLVICVLVFGGAQVAEISGSTLALVITAVCVVVGLVVGLVVTRAVNRVHTDNAFAVWSGGLIGVGVGIIALSAAAITENIGLGVFGYDTMSFFLAGLIVFIIGVRVSSE